MQANEITNIFVRVVAESVKLIQFHKDLDKWLSFSQKVRACTAIEAKLGKCIWRLLREVSS